MMGVSLTPRKKISSSLSIRKDRLTCNLHRYVVCVIIGFHACVLLVCMALLWPHKLHTTSVYYEWKCSDRCSCLPPIIEGDRIRYMHQSYKTSDKSKWPSNWEFFHKTWLDLHGDWTFIFWSDKHNELLAKCMGYEELFSGRSFIQKADLARLMYLQRYGGLYADLDYIALKNHDELLLLEDIRDQDVLLQGRTMQVVGLEWGYARQPEHPIWKHCLTKTLSKKDELKNACAIFVTGPKMLGRCLRSYYKIKTLEHMQSYDGLMIIRPQLIAPIVATDFNSECGKWRSSMSSSWWESKWEKSRCKSELLHNQTYAVTVYSHSWGEGLKC